MEINKSNAWDFTLFDFADAPLVFDSVDRFANFQFPDEVTLFAAQFERPDPDESKDRLAAEYMIGYVEFGTESDMSTTRQRLLPMLGDHGSNCAHLSIAKGNRASHIAYCTKEGSQGLPPRWRIKWERTPAEQANA